MALVAPDPFTNKLLVADPVIVKLPENLPEPETSNLVKGVVVPIPTFPPSGFIKMSSGL